MVRNGCLPEREIQAGQGRVPVKVPRVRDRTQGRVDTAKARRRGAAGVGKINITREAVVTCQVEALLLGILAKLGPPPKRRATQAGVQLSELVTHPFDALWILFDPLAEGQHELPPAVDFPAGVWVS